MPDMTDVFGIDFPCLGEPITLLTFSTFAADVEAALAAVDVNANRALNPPEAGVGLSQSVAVNVATNCVYTTVYWDNMSMTSVGTSPITPSTNGMYYVTIVAEVGGFTTLTSLKAAVNVNGVDQYAQKIPGIGATPQRTSTQALVRLTGGDSVRTQFTWTGTGGPGTVTGVMALTLHSRQF